MRSMHWDKEVAAGNVTKFLQHRYQRSGDTESLQTWGGGKTGWKHPAIPEWARVILDIAVVGGHFSPYPPASTDRAGTPAYILWFKTDPEFNLLEFDK